jgi:23S rRNA (adenine2503-C2)-methyltransferase
MPISADKKDIRKFSKEELISVLVSEGEKPFRAKQIFEWLWKKSALSFDEMTNLSLDLRNKLKEEYKISPAKIDQEQFSNDGTIKSGIKLSDGNLIESVLIPTETRMTACISSQIGCSLSCKFCATGYMERKRNLDPGEIYDQVVLVNSQAEKHFNMPLSNIVFMGMGEPLLNYKNVLEGIDRLCKEDGLNISAKRITVSTAGIAKMIQKLADDNVKFNLALSLHAANDQKRAQIMPINESNNLKVLSEALIYFHEKTGNRITFEYIVFNNFNDSIEDAKELYEFAKNIPNKINIIEYNPIAEADFVNTTEDKLDVFANYLKNRGLIVNVRRSRGKDIDAACGQLANKN